jgi:hypothetical protein
VRAATRAAPTAATTWSRRYRSRWRRPLAADATRAELQYPVDGYLAGVTLLKSARSSTRSFGTTRALAMGRQRRQRPRWGDAQCWSRSTHRRARRCGSLRRLVNRPTQHPLPGSPSVSSRWVSRSPTVCVAIAYRLGMPRSGTDGPPVLSSTSHSGARRRGLAHGTGTGSGRGVAAVRLAV